MRNSEGDYWRPGMDWFRPKLMTCAIEGCGEKFYQRCNTGRKYCDDHMIMREQNKLAKLKKRSEKK